jgi:hypothetical protein
MLLLPCHGDDAGVFLLLHGPSVRTGCRPSRSLRRWPGHSGSRWLKSVPEFCCNVQKFIGPFFFIAIRSRRPSFGGCSSYESESMCCIPDCRRTEEPGQLNRYSDYGPDGRGVGVRVPVGARFFSSPRRLDWFWGPPSLLSSRHGGSFPGSKAAGA